MRAANYDLIIDRASEFQFALTVQNPSGGAVNLTGCTAYAQVNEFDTKKLVAEFSADLSGLASGQIILSLPAADTLLMNAQTRYEWDLFLVGWDPSPTRLLYGDVTCKHNFYKGAPID